MRKSCMIEIDFVYAAILLSNLIGELCRSAAYDTRAKARLELTILLRIISLRIHAFVLGPAFSKDQQSRTDSNPSST